MILKWAGVFIENTWLFLELRKGSDFLIAVKKCLLSPTLGHGLGKDYEKIPQRWKIEAAQTQSLQGLKFQKKNPINSYFVKPSAGMK